MSTGVLSPPFAAHAPGRFSGTRWIISQRDDLVWFVGSALVGYLALALLSAGVSLSLLSLHMAPGSRRAARHRNSDADVLRQARASQAGMAAVGPGAAAVRRAAGGLPGTRRPVLSLCGLLAALSHHQTTRGIHDAVESQEQRARRLRDAPGPLVSAGLGSDPSGAVRDQDASAGRQAWRMRLRYV